MKAKSKRQQVIDLVRAQSVIRPRDLKEHGLSKDSYIVALGKGALIVQMYPSALVGHIHLISSEKVAE